MRRFLKILAWFAGLLLLLVLAGLVAAQSPKVQTYLARKATEKLQERFPADISISLLTVRPFDALVIEDLLLKDPQPYIESMDTVIYVHNLTAKFSLRGLFSGDGIHVGRLKLRGGIFNLGYEPDDNAPDGTRMTLYRVLGLQESEKDEPSSWGSLLTARSVEVKDFVFRMCNPVNAQEMEEEGRSYGEGVIDWNDFSVRARHILASHVAVADNHITGTVERLEATEQATGFRIDEASALKVDVGEQCARMEGLRLHCGESDLHFDTLVLDGPIDDYGRFIDRIWLEGDIRPGSRLSLPTIRYFSDGLEGLTFSGNIQGHLQGYVNDFKLEDVLVEDPLNDVRVAISGRMWGLPEMEDTRLDFQVRRLDFGLDKLGGFLRAWSPDTDLDLKDLAKGERFRFEGKIKGFLNQMDILGTIGSGIGSLRADITLKGAVGAGQPIVIGGKVDTDKLDLGRIAGTSSLGPLTMKTGVEATFPRGGDMQVRIDSLHISRLTALDYDYSNISAVGTYSEKAFDGRIIAADPNLSFLFQGLFNLSRDTRNAAYRFYASLGYADLHALHLDSRPRSKVSLQAYSNFLRTEKGDLLGDINLSGISLENASGRHDIGDLVVKAHANDNMNRINLESNFLEGTFVGDAGLGTFLNDVQYLVLERDVPALLGEKLNPWEGDRYELALKVKSAQELLNFLVPGLYVEKNTALNLKVDREGMVSASVKSGRLAFNDKFVKDFQLSFDNANQSQTATVTGKQISLSGTQILNNSLTLYADDNQIGLGYTFDNGEEQQTRAQLYLSGDLSRDEGGLVVNARALPSNIYYKGNGWGLSSDDITYSSEGLQIRRLAARHDDEQLLIHGGYSSARADTLSIQMEKFDIGLVNTIGGNLPSLEGHATGHAMLISPAEPSPGLLASITCDSTYVAGRRLGQLQISSTWDEESGRFLMSLQNLLGGKRNIEAEGYLQPENRAVHASARLDRLNMGYAAPLLNSLFSQFGGYLSGEVGLDGTLDGIHLSSRGLRVDDGALELDYTRVPYQMAGELSLDDEGLHFRKVSLSDGLQGKGTVTGSILLGGFKDFALDTHVQIRDMKVINLAQGQNDLLYGQVTATGRADITGPLNRLLLDVNATTSQEGDLHIVLGSSSSDRSREMLTFTVSPDQLESDPYELMMAANNHQTEDEGSSDFRIRLRINATPEMQVNLDMNEESTLNARGRGSIEIDTRLSQGTFSLNGDYDISQGSFIFSAMNLVSRKFTIQDGSTIRFNGEVWDTDLDVKGLYTTKASLGTLVATESGASSRRTVNCGINITGRLRNPEVNFSIDVPDLNPATQAQVDGALNTVDKVQKQFVYLLLAGNFLPAEDSGVTSGGTDALFSNVSSIMSGQINNIFQKLDIPLDMGLNYQTTQAGSNIFDVALSTQLFNNRVIVNGTVGNKQLIDGTSTNEVAGDIDIEIKLTRSGALRLKLFSHSADSFTAYLDNSQRHGGGISYQRDFNSFLQFLKSFFAKRGTWEEQARLEALEAGNSIIYNVDQEGKITLK